MIKKMGKLFPKLSNKSLSYIFIIMLTLSNIKISPIYQDQQDSAFDISLEEFGISFFDGAYGALQSDCIWNCSYLGDCPFTMEEHSCDLYVVSSANCGIYGDFIYVSGYSGDYCKYW